MNQENYQKTLASLNEKQRQAVETIYGPVLVLAGPGSGKTQLLSARVAHILQETDYSAENILCLTFTDNAVKNMRERLAGMIGHDAYRVSIMTFHSFGNEIIQKYRAFSREYSEAETLDDITAYGILDIITQSFDYKHPYKPGFKAAETLRELIGDIGDLKKSGFTPEKYKAIIEANHKTLKILSELTKTYWKQIDTLGQKKEEKLKKGELFIHYTEEITKLLSDSLTGLYGYQSLARVILDSLSEAILAYGETGSSTPITAWRNTWTELSHKKERRFKEELKIEKQFALAEVYGLYQSALKEKGYIDFSDMILEAIRLLETHEVIRLNLAEKYQIIMIDEFQDTNEAQMRLIDMVTSVDSEQPNIFAVGDDDQSIYKFQGANTKNIKDFSERYDGTELIILEKNYRSHTEIIETSRRLLSESQDIKNIFPEAEKKFEAHRGNGGVVEKYIFETELDEIVYIRQDIEKKIASGVAPQDIAVITKKNKSLEIIAKNLLDAGIPVSVSKEESLFELEEMKLLSDILKLLGNLDRSYMYEDGELFISILSHPVWGIERLTLWNLSKTLYHARSEKTRSIIEQLRMQTDVTLRDIGYFFIELTQRSRYERLEDIIDYITGANTLSYEDEYYDGRDDGENINQLQITLLDSTQKNYISPYFSYYFGTQNGKTGVKYARHLTHLKKFIDTVRSYKKQKDFLSLSDALEILALRESYNLHLKASTLLGNESHSVQCISVHKAKGLEWKHVYVPFITTGEYKQGKFGAVTFPKNLPLQAEKDNMEDIERLLYTAATRAESHLTLSYSLKNTSEKTLEPLPSLAEMQGEFCEQERGGMSAISTTLELDAERLVMLPYLGDEQSFLRERVEKNFSMNVSALQNFLDITSGGPQSFVKRNLLRFPQAKNIAASYGTAVHNALEAFMQDYSNSGTFSQKLLLESFEESMRKEGFEASILEDFLTRGNEKLLELYPEISGTKYEKLQLEYNFSLDGGVWLPRENGEAIKLTGKIDKVEQFPDDSLLITDYKTGSGFEGFTFKGPDYLKVKQWKYHLQLAFYDILFELSNKYKVFSRKRYELFFVERDKKTGELYRIEEYIQEGERERAKKLIRAVMTKIENLDFPDVSHYPQSYEGIRQFEEDLLEGKV
ncbi:ATP-dependent helicase [Candidatus Gracilibacteria bacterium]|nr:ATP-dependent helicase [Candidatus Gracilibacteria bacterium]